MPAQPDHRNQALDPRLRRLVDSRDDQTRLRDDLAEAFVNTAREPAPDEPVHLAELTTEVLVRLRPETTPPVVPGVRWVRIVDNMYAAEVPVTALETLAASPEVSYVEAGRPLYPDLDGSLPATKADRLHPPPPTGSGLTGTGVVVGIIDYGLDYTLDDFRRPDGTTRIAFLWDQELDAAAGEHPPAGYDDGVEYRAEDINKALETADPFSIVRHKPDPASHGTHVAGIAVGNGRSADAQFPAGRYIGAAPDATIIFVQPRGITGHASQAVAYIFQKAAELSRPCVINMSLGHNGSSHDGESLAEQAIDRLLEGAGRAFVKSAGNEHTWRGHASGRLGTGQQRTLQWRVVGQVPPPGSGVGTPGPVDRTPNRLEVWYSSRDRLSVTLVSPGGEATPVVGPGQRLEHRFASDNVVYIRSERFSALNGDAQILITVHPAEGQHIEPGTWRVVFDAIETVDGRFDAWIERDVRSSPANQSFFPGPDFDPTTTISIPGTLRNGVAVANYDYTDASLQDSSGRGPTRDGRDKPELAAPGAGGAIGGILSAHALGGRPPDEGGEPYPVRIAYPGTSMSAPHVAGIVALMFQRRPDLTAAQIRHILIAAATNPAGSSGFDTAWGYGTVDAAKAIELAADGAPIAWSRSGDGGAGEQLAVRVRPAVGPAPVE